jgi:hypothetical protein
MAVISGGVLVGEKFLAVTWNVLRDVEKGFRILIKKKLIT